MQMLENPGPHLHYPFDLLPGGWLLVVGSPVERQELVRGLAEAAYGDEPLWRVPPVLTVRPATTGANSDEVHHEQVVRRARTAGRFVVMEGSWLEVATSAAVSDLIARCRSVWGCDEPSMIVALLDGDTTRTGLWLRVRSVMPQTLLLHRDDTREERFLSVFAEMRRLGLHGRLA